MSRSSSTMLIARNREFGPPQVVRVEEAPIPQAKKGEILVRAHASTVTAADWRLRSKNVPRGFGFIMSLIFGFRKPKYLALGTCLAGEVVETAEGVTEFSKGDRVVANLGMKLGGHAQYSAISAMSPVARIPDGLSFEDAAAMVFGGTTALAFLRDKLKIQKGDRLLVIGAGGAVGSAAIQIGKIFGARVTGVCSTDKISLVQSLGAEQVIDYKKVDWRSGPETYDLILDAVGGVELSNSRSKLAPRGKIGLVVADLPMTFKSLWISATNKQKMLAGPIAETREDLEQLLSWMVEGKFKPVIGNRFSLQQIVEAHELVDQGHKVGNAVVTM